MERGKRWDISTNTQLKNIEKGDRDGTVWDAVLIRRSVYMSMVHLKNDVFSTFFPSPLYQCCYLSLLFRNCIQKAMTFVCLSWDVGFKTARPILLIAFWNRNKGLVGPVQRPTKLSVWVCPKLICLVLLLPSFSERPN